jgi:hypothetical protein
MGPRWTRHRARSRLLIAVARRLVELFGRRDGNEQREAGLFLRGYAPIEVDPLRLAYYHSDWAIQDLVGYAERVLVTDFGPASRAEALRIFMSIFDPGGEVDVALG